MVDDLLDAEALLACPDLAHLSQGQIRVWATRGEIKRHGKRLIGRRWRTVYSLKEVRDFVRNTSTPGRRLV